MGFFGKKAALLIKKCLLPLQRRQGYSLLLAVFGTAFVAGLQLKILPSFFDSSSPALQPPPSQAEAEVPAPPPAAAVSNLRRLKGTVRAGTGFSDNLKRAGLPSPAVGHITEHLSELLDFRRCRAGDRFYADIDDRSSLIRFAYRTGPLEEVVLEREGDSWKAERTRLSHELQVMEVKGEIKSSLFDSLGRLGEKDSLTVAFVDIFAWDIDFAHELRQGDTFRIVVEKIYREGAFLSYGRILAAEYRMQKENHRAYFFPWPDGSGDYFSPDGRSLRRSFLRSPVSYSRISSGFSGRRLHPVTKKVQPHFAIDFAAPAGTPVWAPADGTVSSLSYDKRNGRKIVLRHPNGYDTYFLHLSRFSKGLKKGKKVRQKEIIGYVGSTGLATGPHLDYRMKRHGRWRNPLKEEFPRGEPLPKEYEEEFARYQSWLNGDLFTPAGSLLADGRE